MLTIAVAALAMARPLAHQGNSSPICPLYDIRTATDTSGNVTINFYLSVAWNNNVNNANKFSFFFSNGNVTMNNFGPGGTWFSITPSAYTPPAGNMITMTFPNWNFNSSRPAGVLWVQYNASANETMDAIPEYCVVATSVGGNQQGTGDRPGSIVPIFDTPPNTNSVSKQSHNQAVTFYLNTGFTGWPNGKTPGMWCNTGNNNSPYPGNGWQNMNYSGLSVANGQTYVTATGHPNSNAGYYMVGYQQTYIPNGGSYLFTEFSGFIRTLTAS